jgi:hypothetical protein
MENEHPNLPRQARDKQEGAAETERCGVVLCRLSRAGDCMVAGEDCSGHEDRRVGGAENAAFFFCAPCSCEDHSPRQAQDKYKYAGRARN